MKFSRNIVIPGIVAGGVSATSQEVSVADAALSVRIDTVSQGVSVLSQGLSVLSQAVSVVDAALSVRIDTQSQSVSVLSQGLSVLSNANSAAHVSLEVHASTASAAATSADAHANTASAAATSADGHANTASAAATSADGHANTVSAAAAVAEVHASTASAAATSVLLELSQAISVLSVANAAAHTSLEVHASAASAAVTSVDARVNALSNILSVTGQVRPQIVAIATDNNVSTAALGNCSGLAISVSAGGVYLVDGIYMFDVAVLGSVGFGFTFPNMTTASIQMFASSAMSQAIAGQVAGRVNQLGSGSIIVSVSVAATASNHYAIVNGIFNVATTGTIQAQARVSVSTVSMTMRAGSFLRCYRIV